MEKEKLQILTSKGRKKLMKFPAPSSWAEGHRREEALSIAGEIISGLLTYLVKEVELVSISFHIL